LLSNAWDNLRQTMHERWDIDSMFDELIISAEVKLVKPDPRIYQLALDRLGVQSAETVYVDDMEENVLAARKEGMLAIHHQETKSTISTLKQYLGME
jgi:HAD superfamily hydrolase (TIGR01509 family)